MPKHTERLPELLVKLEGRTEHLRADEADEADEADGS